MVEEGRNTYPHGHKSIVHPRSFFSVVKQNIMIRPLAIALIHNNYYVVHSDHAKGHYEVMFLDASAAAMNEVSPL